MRIYSNKDGRKMCVVRENYCIDVNRAPKCVELPDFVGMLRTMHILRENASFEQLMGADFDILEKYRYNFHYRAVDPSTGMLLGEGESAPSLFRHIRETYPNCNFDIESTTYNATHSFRH